jgi:hypothetical protein
MMNLAFTSGRQRAFGSTISSLKADFVSVPNAKALTQAQGYSIHHGQTVLDVAKINHENPLKVPRQGKQSASKSPVIKHKGVTFSLDAYAKRTEHHGA